MDWLTSGKVEHDAGTPRQPLPLRPCTRPFHALSWDCGRLAHATIDARTAPADLGHIDRALGRCRSIPSHSFLRCLRGAEPALVRNCQLAGGDDYELVFSCRTRERHELAELAAQLDLPLWRFGRIIKAGGLRRSPALDEHGRPCPQLAKDSIIIDQGSFKPPSLSFLLSHPAHLVACPFGSVLSPFALEPLERFSRGRCFTSPGMDEATSNFTRLYPGRVLHGGVLAVHKDLVGADLGVVDHGIVLGRNRFFWLVSGVLSGDFPMAALSPFCFSVFDIVKPTVHAISMKK
ncbi:MAG: hypothetical protein IPI89_06305 [Propionivibrio sp.]|nr:hypothetical protein [Propionivibrio sp.]